MLAGPPGSRARRALAAGRGALIGGPAIVVVCWLLTTANPAFRSWFGLAPLARHALLIAIGAWAVLGLGRAASAARPVSPSPQVLTLSPAEACVIVGGLGAVYAAFTVAQLEALSGAGHRILVTRGLTYAQYAAFGLTLPRLACLAAACWIAVVFLLLAATLPKRGLRSRYFPAAMVISGLMAVAVWAIVNPAGIVARTDADRAQSGRRSAPPGASAPRAQRLTCPSAAPMGPSPGCARLPKADPGYSE
jgi:Domain of unknown function (DUF4173)